MMRKKKPNIVLITPDSQRHDTISSMGNSKIKTPNLDKLCSEGVVFTRCYSASPECVPARVTIKTGLNPWLSGSTNNAEGISPQIPTIMSVLSKRGYHTQAIEECGNYIVVETNGDVYPCDFFVHRNWKLGNILDTPMEDLFRRARSEFGRLKKVSPPDCKNCR